KMQICGMMGGRRLDENTDNVFTSSSRINSTWGGNLIDMVRSSICLEVIEKEGLIDNARRMGEELLAGLGELAGRHEMISNVRGRGLFVAFTLPSRQLRDTFHSLALEADLLTLKSGTRSIRLRPSLNISADEVAEALGIFEQTAKALEADQVA
ncbi:MAG: aminotransferase class III-fold pyridoxal phosphate-dependent enzyme, partial [Candidatus Poseidoniales archaeon]|nr:aminotransferase class III-fold pyridoxal phosphate-dependent enzyme [Candidatus Poseidoniales archaeon]